jgi:hypothetical protein
MTPLRERMGVSDPGGGSLPQNFCPRPGFFQTRPKTAARPVRKLKKNCSCILEGRLTTNPILSALHLQGLKSIIYVHFPQVNKPLIGISFPEVKPSMKNVINLEIKKLTKFSLTLRLYFL